MVKGPFVTVGRALSCSCSANPDLILTPGTYQKQGNEQKKIGARQGLKKYPKEIKQIMNVMSLISGDIHGLIQVRSKGSKSVIFENRMQLYIQIIHKTEECSSCS